MGNNNKNICKLLICGSFIVFFFGIVGQVLIKERVNKFGYGCLMGEDFQGGEIIERLVVFRGYFCIDS